jgi:hypothetical protein
MLHHIVSVSNVSALAGVSVADGFTRQQQNSSLGATGLFQTVDNSSSETHPATFACQSQGVSNAASVVQQCSAGHKHRSVTRYIKPVACDTAQQEVHKPSTHFAEGARLPWLKPFTFAVKGCWVG